MRRAEETTAQARKRAARASAQPMGSRDAKERAESVTHIRPINAGDEDRVRDLLTRRWASPELFIEGKTLDAAAQPGLIAEADGELCALVTTLRRDHEWEILTIDSLERGAGLGTRMLEALVEQASAEGIARILVRLTNDNLDSMRFFQRRGFRLKTANPGAIDTLRTHYPELPLRGQYDIPIHDELIFARPI